MKKNTSSIIIVTLFIAALLYFSTNESDIKDWQISADIKNSVSFKYPEKLPAEYIRAVDWPPQIQIIDKPYACTEGGSKIAGAKQTINKIINKGSYCITKSNEGAAGSIYTEYYYEFEWGGKTAVLALTIREVQCANYDDPQKTACEKEREAFNLDELADKMARSLKSI
jgi:hypothetical protein